MRFFECKVVFEKRRENLLEKGGGVFQLLVFVVCPREHVYAMRTLPFSSREVGRRESARTRPLVLSRGEGGHVGRNAWFRAFLSISDGGHTVWQLALLRSLCWSCLQACREGEGVLETFHD